MQIPREIELKFELEPSRARGAGRTVRSLLPAGSETRHLASRYFDTADFGLRRKGLALRVRRDGDRLIQTLKAGDGHSLVDRAEWQGPVSGSEPDLAALPDGAPRETVASLGPLSALFETRIERTIWTLARGSSEIEVALDEGSVQAGAAESPIRELELELKGGSIADLFALARDLSGRMRLRIGVRSKSERGYALLAGTSRPARFHVKAEPVVLVPDGTAGEAFRRIALSCIRHFRLNEPAIASGRDAEALHQARVAVRRLRSAFTLFKHVVAGPEADRLKAELRLVSRALGEARNLDVYLGRKLPEEATGNPDEPGLAELAARAGQDRERAYDRVDRKLASRRFRLAMIDLMAFVECGAWLGDDALAAERDAPVAEFAAHTLSRVRRRVRKAGRHLERLTPEGRHRVRIEAKKLRYASEFFASLYGGGKTKRRHRRFVGALETLQTALGDLNDIATGREMAIALARSQQRDTPPALLFAAGHLSGAADARQDALVEEAADAHRTFRKAEPFW